MITRISYEGIGYVVECDLNSRRGPYWNSPQPAAVGLLSITGEMGDPVSDELFEEIEGKCQDQILEQLVEELYYL